MDTATVLLLGSGLGVLLLALVYRVEEARGQRFFASLRELLDRGVLWLNVRLHRRAGLLRAGGLRLFLRLVLHYVLQVLLTLVKKIEMFVESRIRHNRREAKDISRSLKRSGHLHELAVHREATSLNEQQKRQLRSFE